MTGQVNKYFSEFFPISDLEFWSEKQQRLQQPTSSIVFFNEKSYANTIYLCFFWLSSAPFYIGAMENLTYYTSINQSQDRNHWRNSVLWFHWLKVDLVERSVEGRNFHHTSLPDQKPEETYMFSSLPVFFFHWGNVFFNDP